MSFRPRLLALGALLCALWSCSYAMSTLQEPRTLAPGKVRYAQQIRVGQGAGRRAEAGLRPAIDVGFNVGLLERLELQLAGYTTPGGRVGIKALLVDWPALTLAVVPTYQVQRMAEDTDSLFDEEFHADYRVQTAIVPVVAGLPLGPHVEALLGLDVHAGRRRVSANEERNVHGGPVLALGAHVGLAVRGPHGHGSFVPQCGVLVSALSAPLQQIKDPTYDIPYDALRRGSLRWECALAFTVGGRQSARAR